MSYQYQPPNSGQVINITGLDKLLVYNYNNIAGDDFRVYYNEQAANFIVPQTVGYANGPGDQVVGSPTAGLTNAQNWAQYGVAIAGAVAPATATTRSGIIGLVNTIRPQS